MGNEIRLVDLAARIGARLDGDGGIVVKGVAPIEEATAGQVTFLANPKYSGFARTSAASAIIAKGRVEGSRAAFLLSENPYYAFACAVELFHRPMRPKAGVSPASQVHPGARLGKDVTVSSFVVIEDGAVVGDRTVLYPGVVIGEGASVGEDCLFYPHVVLYHGVRVGARVILHAGCVIGSDGFGFAPSREGYKKIPQVGTVEIGDDVEIGANATVDRAALGVTRIGRGSKLDNLVQVGHNVAIGSDTVIAALTGIAGSCRIGSRVMIGGQAGLAGHLEVEDGIMLGAKCGVADTLRASEAKAWSGIPAIPHPTWLRMVTLLPKLPELFRRVKRLEEGKNPKGEE
ncbi:MAG: UDP-3-O-(3-hydroxymyristoyl)glucosamine N-acyltransferase [Deltaproteobacteria bacterium]|nr:UDP-3-O-(3-hydroxymyristoyl)glucosamine N-acyltransferase [Deltaproteobacteria bacterium]